MLKALELIANSWPLSVMAAAGFAALAILGIVRHVTQGSVARDEISKEKELELERFKRQGTAVDGKSTSLPVPVGGGAGGALPEHMRPKHQD